ncbi:MAG: mannose-1-phosphate guanylyltransferase [Cyclobacteriaceae bacterium]|nr:mannose-1-phosphate guanylyltransferase [Cyclobacteriaceae bacterium]
MSNNTYVVIMAGGIGSRFWPASRNQTPKQFLDILGTGKSLLQITYERFCNIVSPEKIYFVTNQNYGGLIKEQIPEISEEQILKEPIGRNTAACVSFAAHKIKSIDENAIMVVAPSDHAIFNEKKFTEIIQTAIKNSKDGDKLVTIGVKPHRPETGYGYIQYHHEKSEIKKVKTFTEKPEETLAKKFVESGDFVWNSGMFIWHVDAILSAFESYAPEIYEIFHEAAKSFGGPEESKAIGVAYSQCKSTSIDYAVMEKAKNVYVIPGDFGWSDLGSWSSLHEISQKDKNGNLVDAESILLDVNNCIIKGPKDKLIVVEGLTNYLVAEYGNAILICNKDNERKFREIFSLVKKETGDKYL